MSEYSVEEVRRAVKDVQRASDDYYPLEAPANDLANAACMLTAYADLLERIEADESAKGRIDFKGMWNAMSDRSDAPLPARAAQGEVCKICGKDTPHHHLRGTAPTPAPPINLAAVREVIESHINEAKKLRHDPESQDYLYEQADKLEAALPELKP